ncbi:hypothetical protein GCM10009547_13500 [Sporichthya brevicatena]|uniref:Uncharacterized protein n=2 Tax=Sporichthya brevicatena TaxID=171442 RepID=A0ABN1GJQ6_9ACTN
MLTLGLLQLVDVVTAADPSPAPVVIDEDKVSPGFIALALLIAMFVVVFFLIKSMQNRLRNIDVDRHSREQDAKRRAAGEPPAEPDNS